MGLFSPSERILAKALSKLAYANPFLPARIEHEREALGVEFAEPDAVWNPGAFDVERPNIVRLIERSEKLVQTVWERLVDGGSASADELALYQDSVIYMLYHRSREPLRDMILAADSKGAGRKAESYADFLAAYDRFLTIPGCPLQPRYGAAHLFSSFFQIRRAFHHIFRFIVGSSMPAARLRAAAWESIFTADMERYQRILYGRMADFTTLIVGPSGTGKELVARAIGLSRYIPFDPRTRSFTEDFRGSFYTLNISALSPTLIESELFGHRRGAFTGALEDRAGWLEVCRPLGTVFLDEVGDIDPAIQVKLLRVLQTRTFQRIGDTQTRTFDGKIIAATNRDMSRQMQAGKIREDFYYRLCSDMIVTPSLQEILRESPQELRKLVLFIAQRVTGVVGEAGQAPTEPNAEVDDIADQVVAWIDRHLGREYAWPGNFRELEQCVRNVLIRGEYRPSTRISEHSRQDLASALDAGELTAEELLRRYCTLTYAKTHSYEDTARRLKLDRRTVKAKVDEVMLLELKAATA